MEWFTADTHFGHAKIIQHSKRPFKHVDEMDSTIIANWNRVVRNTDTVYHLGDFCYRNARDPRDYFKQLNGHIHIIWGNHDDELRKKFWNRGALSPYLRSAQDVKYLHLHGEKIYLSHYAHRTWRSSHHGSWHLYGHSHGQLPNYHKSMDVGVDPNKYVPVSFEEIKSYMDTQDVTLHHPEVFADPWNKD